MFRDCIAVMQGRLPVSLLSEYGALCGVVVEQPGAFHHTRPPRARRDAPFSRVTRPPRRPVHPPGPEPAKTGSLPEGTRPFPGYPPALSLSDRAITCRTRSRVREENSLRETIFDTPKLCARRQL